MKRNSTRLLTAVVLLLISAWVAAQDGTYRLMPEDVIRIQIYNETQFNASLPIGKDGNISAPFVGIVRAVGKTTTELEQELSEIYEKKLRIRKPIVSITIERFREMRATVLGPVARAGAITFRPGDTVLTLVGLAGAANGDTRADLRRATLRRNGSREFIPLDLDAMLYKGDTSQNFVLEDGDELIIPENRKNRILVLGSVPRPGTFTFMEGMKLSDAIALAGYEIPRTTKFSGTTVLRESIGSPDGYSYIRADFVKFLNKRDPSQNIPLVGGDIVWVPNTGAPNINEISQFLNAAFFADRVLFRDGIFGFRPLSFIGR